VAAIADKFGLLAATTDANRVRASRKPRTRIAQTAYAHRAGIADGAATGPRPIAQDRDSA
jgi:hypothetical protein